MKKIILLLFSMIITNYLYSFNRINYFDPVPGASYISTLNNIVLGFDNPLTLSKTSIENSITVTGSRSLRHEGTVIICSGNKKIIFKPNSPFDGGEKITVTISGRLLNVLYTDRKKYEYSFNTSPGINRKNTSPGRDNIVEPFPNLTQSDGMPAPPQLTVTVNNNPSDGYLYLAPYSSSSFNIIANKSGLIYWYSQPTWWSGDFKKQPNGYMTYWDGNLYKHIELDLNYNPIDTFTCGNGYQADIHELRVLTNGYAFLIAYDTQTVDMSQIVQGGNPNASVIGLIIQELEENKNVVFQWRSWDHFQITDATHENLLSSVIDYVHGNAIEIENDDAILLSSRHLDEITKIDLTTGNIVWRLGGKNNQFTFINDTIGFSHQHAIRRTESGNITLFDNGNYHTPSFSRAVEYSLDEENKTATLVWQFRHNPDVYGAFMGYVQRLENGNTLISWGGANVTVTEVTPAGSVVFEAKYPSGVYTYRAYKFDLNYPVAIQSGNSNIPAAFKLNQNYPNPFNPSTLITYDIPRASYVELSVYDITGRKLKDVVSEFQQPGSYSAVFDGSQYSSGLYICRLKADDFTSSEKMILVK
jgi:hypothetical protein